MQSDVSNLKNKIKDAVKDTTNKNVLLAALTEISIEYLKAGND